MAQAIMHGIGSCRAAGWLRRWAARFARARRGAVAAEFALAIPILLVIALGGAETARYVLLHQKLARTAVTMADLVTQADQLSEGELAELYAAVSHVMEPFDMGERGIVILSSVSASGGDPARIGWQRAGGGGLTEQASALGVESADAVLPSGFVVRDGESVVVAEVFYDYAPLFTAGLLDADTLYHRAMFRPRFGALTALAP